MKGDGGLDEGDNGKDPVKWSYFDYEGESKGLDDELNVGVSKRVDSKMNHGFSVSNWVNVSMRKRERSQKPPMIWW